MNSFRRRRVGHNPFPSVGPVVGLNGYWRETLQTSAIYRTTDVPLEFWLNDRLAFQATVGLDPNA